MYLNMQLLNREQRKAVLYVLLPSLFISASFHAEPGLAVMFRLSPYASLLSSLVSRVHTGLHLSNYPLRKEAT